MRHTDSFRKLLKPYQDRITLTDPAKVTDFAEVKRRLGIETPEELQQLFEETNGILDEYHTPLVWDVRSLIKENIEFRTFAAFKDLYMPFDAMLLFGAGGGGDLFFLPIQNLEVRRLDVFRWDHETDSRTRVANSLGKFLVGALNGTIRL